MNYISVVYGVIALIVVIDWFVRGRRHYRSQATRHEDAEHLASEQTQAVR